MKLSKQTLSILKNYANINSNLLLKEGKILKTVSPQNNVFSSVTVEEEFPREFGIYDLNQFLGVLSLFSDPDIEFQEKIAIIKEGKTSIKYFAAESAVLKVPVEGKTIRIANVDVEFDITGGMLSSAIKTAGILSAPDISIVGENGELQLIVGNLQMSNANTYNLVLGETDKTFKANFKIDVLKMINQDYHVVLSAKKLSRWNAKIGDMEVFVALEASSEFS